MSPEARKKLTVISALILSAVLIAVLICHSAPFAALMIRHRSRDLSVPSGSRFESIRLYSGLDSFRAEYRMSEEQYAVLERQAKEMPSCRDLGAIDPRSVRSVCGMFGVERSGGGPVYTFQGRGMTDVFRNRQVWIIADPPDADGLMTVYIIIY